MEIYLIRHTTPALAKGICYGQTDLEVDMNVFSSELEFIREKLPNAFDAVYSSPLQRCRNIALEFSSQVEFDARLMEMNFGDWEHQNWTDIPQIELNQWMNDFVEVSPPNGENFIQLQMRTVEFLQELIFKEPTTSAIFTHAGNIRSILSHILEIPLNNAFRIQVSYGCVVKLRHSKEMNFELVSIK
jgi:alpha-ribazole phosphatase